MKTEQCLMCIVCFVLGWFVHNVVGRCGFGREYFGHDGHGEDPYPIKGRLVSRDKNDLMVRDAGNTNQACGNCPFAGGIGCDLR